MNTRYHIQAWKKAYRGFTAVAVAILTLSLLVGVAVLSDPTPEGKGVAVTLFTITVLLFFSGWLFGRRIPTAVPFSYSVLAVLLTATVAIFIFLLPDMERADATGLLIVAGILCYLLFMVFRAHQVAQFYDVDEQEQRLYSPGRRASESVVGGPTRDIHREASRPGRGYAPHSRPQHMQGEQARPQPKPENEPRTVPVSGYTHPQFGRQTRPPVSRTQGRPARPEPREEEPERRPKKRDPNAYIRKVRAHAGRDPRKKRPTLDSL